MKVATKVAATIPAALAGGIVAASLDVIAAGAEAQRFLPAGSAKLWLFLFALYSSLLGLGLLAFFALLLWLSRLTLFGALTTAESSPTAAPVSAFSLGLTAVIGAAAFGGMLYPVALLALSRFHHAGLVALLVGAEAMGLWLLGLVAALILLALLPAPPAGSGLRPGFAGPRSLYAVGWSLGLFALGAAVTLILRSLQHHPHMNSMLRALNLALYAPIVALLCTALGHFLGRGLAVLVRRRVQDGWFYGRAALVFLPALVLLLGAGLSAQAYREPLRILNWRPIETALAGGLIALLLWWPLRRVASSRWLVLLPLPAFLYGAALHLGRTERVRKAAMALAPLSEQLVLSLAQVADFDRDGVPGRLAIGGSDCDDLDPERHPGAFDWPDNGIDENCNGHDATLKNAGSEAAAEPPTRLPPSVVLRPNVVLITIDALRADHVSAYGYKRKTTPAIDALAAQAGGVLFESAWAHAPSTRYSVPAILTGRYPSTLSWGPPQVHWPPEVLPENRLISEMLAKRGYSTTALLSYHYFERSWGLARGFSDYDTHLMSLHSIGGDPAATSGSSARELADLALSKLGALVPASAERPFFLWIHFYDPHYRYEPHPPPPGEAPFGDAAKPEEVDLYDGEIRYTDQHLGRVLDYLQKSPAWPRTLVLITADHGEGFDEHGIGPDRRHGYHLYANQTKVPLILHVPGLSGTPLRLGSPVGHVNLVPTVMHLVLGRDPHRDEPQLLGSSLLPLLLSPEKADSQRHDAVVFQEVMYEGPTVRKALVSERWHLIQNLIPDGTSELYDLQGDPEELHDVYGQQPAVETALSEQLAAWLDDSAVPPNFARRVAGNLSSTPLLGSSPVGARIGNFLEVVAADVPKPQVSRGERVEVAVIYKVRRAIPAGYRLFAHLRGERGGMLNLDHDFVDGLLPPQRLQPGQYVRDVMTVTIPLGFPLGQANLVVGLFRRDARLEVEGPEGVALRSDRSVRALALSVVN